MPSRLGIVILAVTDLACARRFYEACFDWPLQVETPVYLEFGLPEGLRLGLYRKEGFEKNLGLPVASTPSGAVGPTELYLYDPEPEQIIARALQAGGRLLAPLRPRDWGDLVGYLADPDGNVIAIAAQGAGTHA
jgi:predicted enzyme related to lactoylglutathione lyase